MEISKTRFLATIIITVLLTTSIVYGFRVYISHQPAAFTANVYVTIEQRMGTSYDVSGNLITNIGERMVRNKIGFDNVTNWAECQWISLSNDATPLATWTELPAEVDNSTGFGRDLGTVTAHYLGTDYVFNVTHTFTANASQTLQCAGLNWNNTGQSNNNLFAAATFTQTAFGNGDNLTITWSITWDGN